MDGADAAALIPHMTEVVWGVGQRIHEVAQAVNEVHFPSSAVLSTASVMEGGARGQWTTVGFEGAAGLLAALTCSTSAARTSVQLAGSGISISAAALRDRAGRSPGMIDFALRFAQVEIADGQRSAACQIVHSTEARLARWILQNQDRLNMSALPLTQDFLAALLGVQRATVSAAAGQLRDEGLIRYTRGRLEILHRPALQRRSCACYQVQEELHARLLTPTRDAGARQ